MPEPSNGFTTTQDPQGNRNQSETDVITSRSLRIAVTGSSGLIGSALMGELAERGHTLFKLVRHDPADENEVRLPELPQVDAVINLAGESIGERWTTSKKNRILFSRIKTTDLICSAIAEGKANPKVLLNASAVGYYGNRGDEVLTEESARGGGFLSNVCDSWEGHTKPARKAGVRTVYLRLGMVLAGHGGALGKMLPLFDRGLGGQLGGGRQFMSWITLEDTTAAIYHCLQNPAIRGPVNLTAPNPVTNREFSQLLAGAMCKRTGPPVPAFMVRLLYGEMGQALLLDGQRVVPEKLLEAGFTFAYPDLSSALKHVLETRAAP